MSVNLTTLATNAAKDIGGVLESGESPSASQLSDALNLINNVLDNYSSESSFIPALTRTTQSLTGGTQSYAFSGTRPVAIMAASVINATGPGSPVEVVTAAKWALIPDRQAQSYLTKFLLFDRALSGSTFYVSPVPLGSLTVELLYWSPLTQFADTTTAITLPPGYQRLLEMALAAEWAPQFNKVASPQLQANLAEAKQIVRDLNRTLLGTEVPPPGAGQ